MVNNNFKSYENPSKGLKEMEQTKFQAMNHVLTLTLWFIMGFTDHFINCKQFVKVS